VNGADFETERPGDPTHWNLADSETLQDFVRVIGRALLAEVTRDPERPWIDLAAQHSPRWEGLPYLDAGIVRGLTRIVDALMAALPDQLGQLKQVSLTIMIAGETKWVPVFPSSQRLDAEGVAQALDEAGPVDADPGSDDDAADGADGYVELGTGRRRRCAASGRMDDDGVINFREYTFTTSGPGRTVDVTLTGQWVGECMTSEDFSVSLDGSHAQSLSPGNEHTITFSVPAAGTHTLRVTANAGGCAPGTVRLALLGFWCLHR
jgi:hypothetical protein